MENEPNPEDRWYNIKESEKTDTNDKEDFDPHPTISVSKEDFGARCKPRHSSLAVKLLGK